MGARRWLALLPVLLLVVAVVAVRQQVGRSPEGPASDAVLAPVAAPTVLAERELADVLPGPDGLPGLPLGAARGAVVGAGWSLAAGEHGCARLEEVRTVDGSVVSGWVRDGRLVAVQVLGPRGAAATGDGYALGLPVEEVARAGDADGYADVTMQATGHGPGAAAGVRTAAWQVPRGRTVVVSDLGGAGARWVEVREGAGEPCGLVPELLGTDPPQAALTSLDDALDGSGSVSGGERSDGEAPGGPLAAGVVDDLSALLGTRADALPAADLASRDRPAPGCERLTLGTRSALVHEDVVVQAGQQVGRSEPGLPRVAWRAEVGAPSVRVLERVDRISTVRVREDGLRVAVDYVQRSWVPPGVDALAVTHPPRLERVEVGVGCPSALPWS